MIKLELTAIRKVPNLTEAIHKALTDGTRQVVKGLHQEVVENAPVDTSRLRNNAIWSIDGKEYGGDNQFPTTAPPSKMYEHKPGARPIGAEADMEAASALMRFDQNDDPKKVIGYVGENVKRDGKRPYGAFQEFGWHDKNGGFHKQPYFRPAVMAKGETETVTPILKAHAQHLKLDKMVEVKIK